MRLQNILCGPHDAGTSTSHVPKNVPPSSVETPAWQAGWRGHQWHLWTRDAWPFSVSPPPPPAPAGEGATSQRDSASRAWSGALRGRHPPGGPDRGPHTLGPCEAPSSLVPSIPRVTEPHPLSQWSVPLCPLCWGAHPFKAAGSRTFHGSFPSARLSSSAPAAPGVYSEFVIKTLSPPAPHSLCRPHSSWSLAAPVTTHLLSLVDVSSVLAVTRTLCYN